MKYLLLILLFVSTLGFSQSNNDKLNVSKKKTSSKTPLELQDSASNFDSTNYVTNKSYHFVTPRPSFKGGKNSLNAYFEINLSNIKAPTSYINEEKEYRLSVYFIVTEVGEIKNIKLSKKSQVQLDKLTQEKIIEIFENMPKWNPGILNDTPIALQQSMNIVLK